MVYDREREKRNDCVYAEHTWWGMGILTVFSTALFVTCLWLFVRPLWDGSAPEWAALWPIGLAGFFTPYSFFPARDEYRASQLRKLRNSPKPGTGNVNVTLGGIGEVAMSVQAFRIAVKRRRWLTDQRAKAAQVH